MTARTIRRDSPVGAVLWRLYRSGQARPADLADLFRDAWNPAKAVASALTTAQHHGLVRRGARNRWQITPRGRRLCRAWIVADLTDDLPPGSFGSGYSPTPSPFPVGVVLLEVRRNGRASTVPVPSPAAPSTARSLESAGFTITAPPSYATTNGAAR